MVAPRTYLPSNPVVGSLVDYPTTAFVLALGIPWLIVYLHIIDEPGTRWVRRAIWPLGVMMTWIGGGIDDDVVAPGLKCTLYSLGVVWNLDFTIRYAFLDPPTFHPLPRPAPLGRFRHSDPGRALDLLFSGMRKINIPPNRPLTAGRSWLRATVSHFLTASVYLVLYDLLFRSVVVISPDTFGHPSRTGGDFPLFVKELSEGCRLPWFVVWAGLGWVFMAGIMLALHGQYHLTAAISVGVGYNTDEEWPRPMDKPWLADSLNNLWGQRYHQHLRDTFLLWSSPLRTLAGPDARAFHILATLFASGVLHVIMFLPIHNAFKPHAWSLFFVGQALGMLLERAYLKQTGRRVVGWGGRVWVVVWMSLWAGPMIKEVYEAGYIGVARATWTLHPELSGAEWIVWLCKRAVGDITS